MSWFFPKGKGFVKKKVTWVLYTSFSFSSSDYLSRMHNAHGSSLIFIWKYFIYVLSICLPWTRYVSKTIREYKYNTSCSLLIVLLFISFIICFINCIAFVYLVLFSLEVFIYDYLKKRGYNNAAEIFRVEANVTGKPALGIYISLFMLLKNYFLAYVIHTCTIVLFILCTLFSFISLI